MQCFFPGFYLQLSSICYFCALGGGGGGGVFKSH